MAEANQQPAGLPEEPVRVNHTVRNIIIAVVVVALVAVGAFFGVRAFNGSDKTRRREPKQPGEDRRGGRHRSAVGGIQEAGRKAEPVR